MARPNMRTAAAAILIALTACTMKDQDAPPLTGPSEQGTSLQVVANPNVLTQDGSQSTITVIARGPSGQALAALPIRVDVTFKDETSKLNVVTDQMGKLSARNIVTDGNGSADVVFTSRKATDVPETTVGIRFIPVGTDAANTVARTVSIRLLPEGSVGGGGNIEAKIAPPSATTVEVGEDVVFDGSGSTSATGIKTFEWDFDDGDHGSDDIEVHSFSSPGSFNVELTVTDPYGNKDTAHVTITVGAIASPTASFTTLPTTPTAGAPVTFDATASTAASGHEIVNYKWDWGDPADPGPTNTTSAVTTHTFNSSGMYVVTLTVTDDTGRTDVKPLQITIP